ncbi:MAG: PLDc N-terminal domain-containing protein, partial [Casimicrobiaceae bacterium]
MNHLDWGRVYVTSEWLVRIVALVYVPQRRAPNAARAWLLLIFFLPWPGAVLYFLLGRAWMPRRRYRVQKQISELIRGLVPRPESFETRTGHPVPAELLPALRLADSISEFPAVGGCHFELLPEYNEAIERVIAEIG